MRIERVFRSKLATSFVLVCAFLIPRLARGNGAFPAVSQLVADPSDPDHLVLRTTFGLLVTRDRGANWDWLCEAGAGYQNVEPPMAVLPGGTILLGVPGGVSRSSASGCDFEQARGIDAVVFDLARVPAEPEGAVAISGEGTDARLWRSDDGGKSFASVGDVISDFLPTTVDVAATDSDVIYASGVSGTSGVLLRSRDAGKSFTRYVVPGATAARRPFIAAVDPRSANTVYVRLDAQGTSPLQVTRDGGESFVTSLTTTVPVAGFAISPDGATVIASNAYDGTFVASTDTLAFEKVACSGPTCLAFNEAGLFGCGDQSLDGFVVGRSEDLGASFQRLVDLTCVRGPAACDEGTSVGSVCPAVWPDVQQQLGATECAPPDVEPYVGCFGTTAPGDAGAGGATSRGDAGTDGGTPDGGEDGDHRTRVGAEPPGGCNCRVTSATSRASPWWLGALALALRRFRRRDRRVPRRPATQN